MALSASFQRFYDNAAPQVAGALPSAIQAALFETLRDFMKATNIWQTDIEIAMSSATNVYPFAVPVGEFENDVVPPIMATIAGGDPTGLSGPIDIGENNVATRLTLPSTWTGIDITFQVSSDGGATYHELLDDIDSPVFVNVGPDYSIALTPSIWQGIRYFKIRSGTSGAPITQVGSRSIAVTTANSTLPNLATGSRSVSTATISAGQALSGPVDLGVNFDAVRISMPSAWDGTSITFMTSADGVTYQELRDDIGVPVFFNVIANSRVTLDPDVWRGVRYLMVRSGISAAPVPQSAGRIITITTATEYDQTRILGDRTTIVPTMLNGEALSDVIDLGKNYMAARIVLPTGWVGGSLTFQTSVDGVAFDELRDDIGVPVRIDMGAGYSVALIMQFWQGVRFLKVRSGLENAPVPQTNDQDITIIIVPLPIVTSGTAVNRLMNLYNADDTICKRWFWPAELRLPNTIVLQRTLNQSYTLIATLALFPLDPVDSYGNPIFPNWILDNYFDTLFSGTLYRLYVQPQKPWSNAALAATYYKLYMKGRGIAAADVLRQNIYNNQSWCFPPGGITYGRQRGV